MEVPKWSYNDLKSVLRAGSGNREAMPLQADYPYIICLSNQFHGILNGLRDATASDGYERGVIMGFRGKTGGLFVSDHIKGEHYSISAEIQQNKMDRAHAFGIESISSDAHAHPTFRFPEALSSLNPWIRGFVSYWAAFSPLDTYRLVAPDCGLVAMFLVEGNKNLAMFHTMESSKTMSSTTIPSQQEFSDYWLEKFGYKDNFSFISHPINYLTCLLLDPLSIDKAMSDRYHLVLFKGNMNEDLRKIYPPKIM